MPPLRSGVAACSAQLVAALRNEHDINAFVDEPLSGLAEGVNSAHDFVWLNQQAPYDLAIYQLGNSSHHNYIWPYLFRYPGLTVLHDRHVHHARAASLLQSGRVDDYRVEFARDQPNVSPDLAELAIAGFDTHLYYSWPMTRLIAQASRVVAVHGELLADDLRADVPEARVEPVRLGHGIALSDEDARLARDDVRRRLGVPADAILFGCFGALTPDKRIPQVLGAFAATLRYAPDAHLVLAGATVDRYEAAADVSARGLDERVRITGYVKTDEDLTAYIAACDVALNLRWPTAREISGPWLRCLAAGRATVIVDLAHLADIPSLDPRTWTVNAGGRRRKTAARGSALGAESTSAADSPTPNPESRTPNPVCVAIDIVDEDHSLRLAMRKLAQDAELRKSLGAAGREHWLREHSVSGMVDDYRRVIALAASVQPPRPPLPAHLSDDGLKMVEALAHEFGLPSPLR
jgi:glycosyltransferase involved in cell wall biosynthesis